MTSERIKEIQQQTAYPDSVSVQQALLQVWNECSQLPQQETFGSKGSDEHIVDTNEMIYPKTAFEILQPKLTIADTLEFREKHLPEILDAMEEYATSSQTERMYSEEEVLELLLKSKIETSNLYYEDIKEWFKQNKKD